jgi:hypothetical protein
LDFKQEFVKPYQYLYTERSDEGEKQDISRYSDESQFSEEFGWYSMVFAAANENYLDITKVVDSPADEFLFYINFLKRKNELETNRIKRQFKN